MRTGPSKAAEAIVAVLVPPASREEVLGDLYQRYRSPGHYFAEALCAVPLVILSRIRRTTDPQVLLMQGLALYVSFLVAAWFQNPALVLERWGLTRLAIPAGVTMIGLMLEDAYARPGPRSPLRGPAIGLGLALVSQGMFWAGNPDISLPRWILFYGCGMSLLLSSAVRLLFPPVTGRLQGVNAPADWLKQAGEPAVDPQAIILALKVVAAIVIAAVIGSFIADHFALPKAKVISGVLLPAIAFQLWRRS